MPSGRAFLTWFRESVRGQLAFVLAACALLLVFNVVFVFGYISNHESDGRVINLAGRQRMLSQKIIHEASAVGESTLPADSQPDTLRASVDGKELRAALESSADEFDANLAALLDGDVERGIPAANGAVRKQLEQVGAIWEPVDKQVHVLLSGSTDGGVEAAVGYIGANSERLLAEMDAAVSLYEESLSGEIWALRRTVTGLAVAGGVVALAGLAIIGYVVRRREAEARALEESKEALREGEERFRTLLDSTPDAMVIVDGDGLIESVNCQTETLFGYDRKGLRGKRVEILLPERFRRRHIQHRDSYAVQADVRPMGQNMDLYGVRKDGSEFPVDISLSTLETKQGPRFMAAVRDITDRRRMEAELREQARRDSLTGALNHAAIIDELRSAFAAANADAPCAVAMVDVDRLKATNDTYGHQVGDAVLIEVAGALSRRGAVVGRYGGDEFLVVLPSAGCDEAEQYRDEVVAALADARVTESETGASVTVVASIGLAIYPEDGLTIDDIVDLSDSAMYASRRQRPVGAGDLSPSRMLGGERAAAMVGQIVPLLTASGTIEDKLRLVAHRLSVGAGYDAVNMDVFAHAAGLPSARSSFSRVPDEVTDAWQAERRRMEDDPILRHVESTRRALIVEDPQHEERLTEAQRAVMRAAELQSAVVVPLFWEDDMIGVLSVASKRKDAFTAGDIEFLTTIATQITSVVRMATLFDELQTTSGHLAQAREEAVLLLAAAAEAHDTTTGQHLRGVRGLTEALARDLSYGEESARDLGLAAVLHDIGKIRVPQSIITSTGPLSGDEKEVMEKHTVWGADFLAGHPGYELAATVARSHHERWDGSGYPDGLAGEAIPAAATIVAVADSFDAIISSRPYRAARSVGEALREIEAGSGTQFSPNVAEALVRVHRGRNLPVVPAGQAIDQQAA